MVTGCPLGAVLSLRLWVVVPMVIQEVMWIPSIQWEEALEGLSAAS